MPEHRKCRILANGSMQPIKLKGVAQAVFSENLLDIVDLFLYIKMSWLLKTGLYLALDLPQGGGGGKTCIKIFFCAHHTTKQNNPHHWKYFGEATHFFKLYSHQMMSTLQNFWHFSNVSLLHLTIQIDTSMQVGYANSQLLSATSSLVSAAPSHG